MKLERCSSGHLKVKITRLICQQLDAGLLLPCNSSLSKRAVRFRAKDATALSKLKRWKTAKFHNTSFRNTKMNLKRVVSRMAQVRLPDKLWTSGRDFIINSKRSKRKVIGPLIKHLSWNHLKEMRQQSAVRCRPPSSTTPSPLILKLVKAVVITWLSREIITWRTASWQIVSVIALKPIWKKINLIRNRSRPYSTINLTLMMTSTKSCSLEMKQTRQ